MVIHINIKIYMYEYLSFVLWLVSSIVVVAVRNDQLIETIFTLSQKRPVIRSDTCLAIFRLTEQLDIRPSQLMTKNIALSRGEGLVREKKLSQGLMDTVNILR